MKTLQHVIQLIALFVIMASFFACQEVIDPDSPEPTVRELTKQAGEVHNACLMYVNTYLKTEFANVDPTTMTLEKLKAKMKEGCIGFINTNEFFSNNDNRTEALNVFETTWAAFERAEAGAGTMGLSETYLEINADLTDETRNYTVDLLKIMGNSTVPTTCEQGLDSLFDLTLARLGEESAMPILMGCGVGTASFEYWTNHMDDWSELGRLISGIDRPIPGTSRANVSKSDATGAAGGVTASLLSGCAELSFGMCAVAGGLGGGIAGSVAAVAGNMWDEYF